jgi:hypothetical protein
MTSSSRPYSLRAVNKSNLSRAVLGVKAGAEQKNTYVADWHVSEINLSVVPLDVGTQLALSHGRTKPNAPSAKHHSPPIKYSPHWTEVPDRINTRNDDCCLTHGASRHPTPANLTVLFGGCPSLSGRVLPNRKPDVPVRWPSRGLPSAKDPACSRSRAHDHDDSSRCRHPYGARGHRAGIP